MKFTFRNIDIFFRSNCCNKTVEPSPCEKAAQEMPRFLEAKKYLDYISRQSLLDKDLAKTTITIGVQWLGKLAYKEQYNEICKLIKQHIPYNSDSEYIYFPELTKSGVIHFHGVEINTYEAKFHQSFGLIGSRNLHKKSYLKVNNKRDGISDYLRYIEKDKNKIDLSFITNIKKKDLIHSLCPQKTLDK